MYLLLYGVNDIENLFGKILPFNFVDKQQLSKDFHPTVAEAVKNGVTLPTAITYDSVEWSLL